MPTPEPTPEQKSMIEQSREAFKKGEYILLKDYISELREKAILKRITIVTAQQKSKCELAIDIMTNGPVVAVSVLEHGGYNITVKSGVALISTVYNGMSLADAIISASTDYELKSE